MSDRNQRIIILGGPKRGKSTLGKTLSKEHGLRLLCTDPQRLLPPEMTGTPDHLKYSGPGGVGEWVARHWIGERGAIIEGVKAADALKRCMSGGSCASEVCDRLIVLTERVDNAGYDDPRITVELYRQQEQQASHVMAVLEQLEQQLDTLEHWYPVGTGFARSSF